LHPVCHLGQASVLRVTHPVFFLRIGKHTLNLLFSQPVQFFVHRHMPDMLCHLHIVLPDMAQYGFLALGVLGAHPSGGTALAKIASAFVFPVALPVCGGIMQRTVFRTDHIVKVFVIHIGPPGVAVFFGLGAGIAGGKDAAALKNTLADPGCFVGAVRHHGFFLGVILAYFIVQRIKGCTVVDIAGSDVNTNNKIVLVTCCVRFVGKALFVLPLVEYTAFRVGGGHHRFLLSGGFLSLSSEKGFLPCSSRSLFTSSNDSFAFRFTLFGSSVVACLFRLALALMWVPSTKIASVSRYPSSAAAFNTQRNTYSTVAWLNRCLKL